MNNDDEEEAQNQAHAIDSLLLLCQAVPIHERVPEMEVIEEVAKKRQERKQHNLSKKPRTESLLSENGSESIVDQKKISSPSPRNLSIAKKSTKLTKSQNFHKDNKLTKASFDLKEGKIQLLNSSKSTSSSSQQGLMIDKYDPTSRILKLETLPFHLFAAFNSGDLGNLRDIVDSVTTETVSFKTDSMNDPKVGRQHFMKFFEVLEEVHPDAYIVSSDMKVIDHKTMTTTIYIKGTKVIASQNEHYIMKPRLVDNMNLTSLSSTDVDKLRELEHTLISQNRPIEIELVGLTTYGFEDVLLLQNDESLNDNDATANDTGNAINNTMLSSSSSSKISINNTADANMTPKCTYAIKTTTISVDDTNSSTKSNRNHNSSRSINETNTNTSSSNSRSSGSSDTNNTDTVSLKKQKTGAVHGEDVVDSSKINIESVESDRSSSSVSSNAHHISNNSSNDGGKHNMISDTTTAGVVQTRDNNNNSPLTNMNNDIDNTSHYAGTSTPTPVTPNTSTNLPSSSSSSSSTLQPKCPKICDIQISYYLKSFREAVIMPAP